MNETTTTLTTYIISKITLRSSWQRRLPEVLYYKILVARVFTNHLHTRFIHNKLNKKSISLMRVWTGNSKNEWNYNYTDNLRNIKGYPLLFMTKATTWVLYYKILVARVFANFLKSVYASIWDFSRTTHCMSTKFSHSHFKRSKLQFINIWKKTIQPYKSYGSRNFFRKLSISQELLIRSSKKMHMHNFRYTTITWPSFKEIHRVVSEEKHGQILIHIYCIYIYKEIWNFFNEVVMIYNLWNVEKIHFPLFLPQLWRV